MARPVKKCKRGKKPKKSFKKTDKWTKAKFDALVDFLVAKGMDAARVEAKIGTAHGNRQRKTIRDLLR